MEREGGQAGGDWGGGRAGMTSWWLGLVVMMVVVGAHGILA